MAPRWGGLRPEPYDPNARDADNDGVVQEGTAWERPAGTNLVDELGQAIQRGANSATRPSGMRVVSADGKPVDYIPTYDRPGAKRPGGTPSTGAATPLSEHGARSLRERGIPSIREVTTPKPPPSPTPIPTRTTPEVPEVKPPEPEKPASVRSRIKKKNAEILGRMAERGGAFGRITKAYKDRQDKRNAYTVLTPEEDAKFRREKMKGHLDAWKFFLSTGKAPTRENGFEGQLLGFESLATFELRRDGMDPALVQHIIDTDTDDLIAEIEASTLAFHRGIDKSVRVRIKGDAVFEMLEDGSYATTHEEGAIGPMSAASQRVNYEVALGLPREVEADLRPASGYITHEAFVESAKKAFEEKYGRPPTEFDILLLTEGDTTPYGHIELILHPDVAGRTVFARGDSLNNHSQTALMEDATDIEIMNALLGANAAESHLFVQQSLSYLEASLTGDFSRINSPDKVWDGTQGEDPYYRRLSANYIEALVGGSFDTDEIKEVRISPEGRIPSHEVRKATIDEFYSPDGLRSAGMTEEEIAFVLENKILPRGNNGDTTGFPAGQRVDQVMEIRMARRLEDGFRAAGVEKVIQLHPSGLDIMDIENYGEQQSLGNTPEEIRVARARKEIVEELRKSIERKKNPPKPRSGGLLA